MKKIVFEKTYHGFEDSIDLERDISEMWETPEGPIVPAEFQGRLTVTVTYEDDE